MGENTENNGRWRPSPRQQATDWYLTRFMRYIVGGGTIGWEVIQDRGRNPLVLLVGSMLATSTDVLGIVRDLIQQAKSERRSLEDLLNEEHEHGS